MFSFFNRISPAKIIKDHFKTLYDARDETLNIWFEIIPLLALTFGLSAFLVYKQNLLINTDISTYLFGGYSVAGGFLINALMLLADKHNKSKKEAPNDSKETLLKETFYNTSFGVLLCLLSVAACSIYPLVQACWLSKLLSFSIYSFSFFFLHTLLMVIKRLNKVFDV